MRELPHVIVTRMVKQIEDNIVTNCVEVEKEKTIQEMEKTRQKQEEEVTKRIQIQEEQRTERRKLLNEALRLKVELKKLARTKGKKRAKGAIREEKGEDKAGENVPATTADERVDANVPVRKTVSPVDTRSSTRNRSRLVIVS